MVLSKTFKVIVCDLSKVVVPEVPVMFISYSPMAALVRLLIVISTAVLLAVAVVGLKVTTEPAGFPVAENVVVSLKPK